jgi:muconolactone delta-isomerase
VEHLAQSRLSSSARPMRPDEGIASLSSLSFQRSTFAKRQAEGKILAGGPVSGAVALVLIVAAESALELDDLITSLPVWPRMETDVTPLAAFDARRQTLLSRIAELKAQGREPAISNPGAGR